MNKTTATGQVDNRGDQKIDGGTYTPPAYGTDEVTAPGQLYAKPTEADMLKTYTPEQRKAAERAEADEYGAYTPKGVEK